MPKQQNLKKVRPSIAIASLEAYNQKVVMLIHTCKLALQHNMVDPKIADDMTLNVADLESFNTD